MKVTITSNKKEFLDELDLHIARALETIGLAAEGNAKLELSKPKLHKHGDIRPNVDTGVLRNSITHHTTEERAYIGTNVEYAPEVELGTSKSWAYPYLRPAIEDHLDQYKQIIKEELKS